MISSQFRAPPLKNSFSAGTIASSPPSAEPASQRFTFALAPIAPRIAPRLPSAASHRHRHATSTCASPPCGTALDLGMALPSRRAVADPRLAAARRFEHGGSPETNRGVQPTCVVACPWRRKEVLSYTRAQAATRSAPPRQAHAPRLHCPVQRKRPPALSNATRDRPGAL